MIKLESETRLRVIEILRVRLVRVYFPGLVFALA